VDRPWGQAPVARSHRSCDDDLCVGKRSGKRDALRAAAHDEHEKRNGKPDANWPDWYAAYMAAEQAGTELPMWTTMGNDFEMSSITVNNETLGSVTLPTNARGHSGSMSVKTTKQHPLHLLVYLTLLVALVTAHTVWAQATAALRFLVW
jgi:hypothetical protein